MSEKIKENLKNIPMQKNNKNRFTLKVTRCKLLNASSNFNRMGLHTVSVYRNLYLIMKRNRGNISVASFSKKTTTTKITTKTRVRKTNECLIYTCRHFKLIWTQLRDPIYRNREKVTAKHTMSLAKKTGIIKSEDLWLQLFLQFTWHNSREE